ncbi:bifunctional SulP family inorganic anion transporter/carbonic anhydrase [Allokutzneria sp. A3M-2-11 16]|uniref:SulP family inorganic anion transporter n=1 Tax=Allokutzneria sp. A3M-2-11 16 TaxID=2962043 RepID=UPI0020B8AA2D|nr:bifunctional SulP family inorganic anion transporter/carbonic anhydrase [Allokutzneria sp. A3M-2-11 16]MCP3801588.1 bifunctional SulP family inorganic anion transporter/carbonic anhydrase [Allokutzneria sp. A3M-2-11 16]
MINSRRARTSAGEHASTGPPGPEAAQRQSTFATVLRHDLPASLVVLLIAIPLSLGIAAASGAPMISGLIAAVVGGVVAGALSGAPLQVSGPAAGLTVIVAGMIAQYGWAATAFITVCGGAVQLVLGITRMGRAALSLSPAVVHGMLAGIGAVIALSQIHVVLGGQAQSSVIANLRDLPGQIVGHHDAAFGIGIVTFAVLLVWPRIPKVSLIPAPLVAVAVATAVSIGFGLTVPRVDLPDNPLTGLALPTLPVGDLGGIIIAIFTIAAVASVESLLSAVAVDKLHSGARANLDKELVAQGAANMASGALGGLPVTGVIVRSSTNVAAGARTRASAILHGVWIALFVLFLGSTLELIPMAALASVLVLTGIRLVSLAHMRELWRHREFPVYVVTFAGVVFLDLVKGVLLGIAVALLLALWRLTRATVEVVEDSAEEWRVVVRGSLIFLGVANLINELRRVPEGRNVVLELHVDFMDHAGYEAIHDWRSGYERTGGAVRVDEVHDTWYQRARQGKPEQHKSLPGQLPRWFAPWSYWQNMHSDGGEPDAGTIVPEPRPGADPMMLGMHEFQRSAAPLVRPFLSELAERGQKPSQFFISCADSRVVPNMITSSGPGDLFTTRNVGNLVPRNDIPSIGSSVGASIEFAVEALEVPNIVVCGHSHCGAMKASLHGGVREGTHLASWLRHAEPSLERYHAREDDGHDADMTPADRLSVLNVVQQLENLMTYPSVREAVEEGRLTLVGLYFDISDARVHVVDPETGRLSPVDPATVL